MESNSKWRPHPLDIGRTYLAIESFQGTPNARFVRGSRYVLRAVDYSHFDSMTIFSFASVDDGARVQWWWFDNDPETQCKERFEAAA